MKQEFTINLNQRKYPVTIEDHSFEKLGETLKGLLAGKRLAVITDRSVYDTCSPAASLWRPAGSPRRRS